MKMPYNIDPEQIRKALELYLAPGQVTELRAKDARIRGEYRTGTFSGYFDREHIAELVAACQQIEFATAVYFMPNPVNPDLLARCCNRARLVADKAPCTADKDIIARRWLLFDCDPVRPSNISSTAEEKYHAHQILIDLDNELFSRGFPPGIVSDSGNGWHLCIPCDCPADDGGTVERLLKMLARKFDTERAKIDVSVFNPARIWKLPGTLSCKGDHCPELGRPWRMAKIVTVCREVQRV
jgi:hypothetical protein